MAILYTSIFKKKHKVITSLKDYIKCFLDTQTIFKLTGIDTLSKAFNGL